MKLTIHDVGHGSCISLICGGVAMLWDCGRDGDNRPSLFLPLMGVDRVEQLFITNYDEDHISDLVALNRVRKPRFLCRNQSIDALRLRQLKKQGGLISDAMEEMLAMMGNYTGNGNTPLEFPGVKDTTCRNSFFTDFDDTNNCSLVTFLSCNGTNFVFPGDLECEGWEKLLQKPAFCNHLKKVDYFVASHHGRESGYCKKVFDYCKPRAVIVSDSDIKYSTQETTADTYRPHCSGVTFRQREKRYVLSTRSDGDICWPLDFSA